MKVLNDPGFAKLNLDSYRTGDLVSLKCGSPKMVVLCYADTPAGEMRRAVCVWCKSDGSIAEGAFPEAVLVDCDPEPLPLFPPSDN